MIAMRATYQFLAPVHVEVEDGRVVRVTVLDEAPGTDPIFIDGDPAYLQSAVEQSLEGEWPAWEFGH
jgi:hypothetical protein